MPGCITHGTQRISLTLRLVEYDAKSANKQEFIVV